MHHDGAVIVSGRFGKASLECVEHKIEPGIAVDVHVELVAGVPVRQCPFGEHVGFHQPFAVMFRIWVPVRIEVRLSHLHQLGDDRPVGEQLHLTGKESNLSLLPFSDERGGAGERFRDRDTSVCRTTRIDKEGRRERCCLVTEDRLVELPRTGRELGAGFVDGSHPVLVQVDHHLFEAPN